MGPIPFLQYYCMNVVMPLHNQSLFCSDPLSMKAFLIAWKICFLTPVHKSCDPTNGTNYRSFTVLPHLSKIFESIVYYFVKRSMNHILIDQQYNFRPGKSTAIISCIIFTDFKKAFDTIDHILLMNELGILGLGNPFLSWLNSYIVSLHFLFADDVKVYLRINFPADCITSG